MVHFLWQEICSLSYQERRKVLSPMQQPWENFFSFLHPTSSPSPLGVSLDPDGVTKQHVHNSALMNPYMIRDNCHFLLQGIFLTQGLNPHLLLFLHWQAEFLPLGHPGSPISTWQQRWPGGQDALQEGDGVRQACESSSKTTPGNLLWALGSGPVLCWLLTQCEDKQPHSPISTEEGEPVSAMWKKGCVSET